MQQVWLSRQVVQVREVMFEQALAHLSPAVSPTYVALQSKAESATRIPTNSTTYASSTNCLR